MITLQAWLLFAAAMFSIGLFGVLTRRNAIAMLLSIELMANAVNLNLVAFGTARGDPTGQVMALFGMAMTVAEVAVGLAIIIQLHRNNRTIDLDAIADALDEEARA